MRALSPRTREHREVLCRLLRVELFPTFFFLLFNTPTPPFFVLLLGPPPLAAKNYATAGK